MTPRPLGACIRHGYGNSIHAKQSDCVNWFPVAEGVAAPLEPTPRPIGFCDKERKPHEVKHDCLNWSECRVSRPKPTQPTAEEAKHLEALISEVGDGYGINPSCCSLLTDDLPDEGSLAGGILRAFELGRAAVSKNLQEELAKCQQRLSDEMDVSAEFSCEIGKLEAEKSDLKREITALRETK